MFWASQPTKAFALEQAWVRVLVPAVPRLAGSFPFAVAVRSIGKERSFEREVSGLHVGSIIHSLAATSQWPPSEHHWRPRPLLFTRDSFSACSHSLPAFAMHLPPPRRSLVC